LNLYTSTPNPSQNDQSNFNSLKEENIYIVTSMYKLQIQFVSKKNKNFPENKDTKKKNHPKTQTYQNSDILQETLPSRFIKK